MNRAPLVRRTRLRSSQPIMRASRLRARTPRRAAQERTYRALRVQFLTVNPWCGIGARGCTGAASDVHHKRGRVGPDLLDVKHWLPACRPCHEQVTTHPAWAMRMGWSEPRTGVR